MMLQCFSILINFVGVYLVTLLRFSSFNVVTSILPEKPHPSLKQSSAFHEFAFSVKAVRKGILDRALK